MYNLASLTHVTSDASLMPASMSNCRVDHHTASHLYWRLWYSLSSPPLCVIITIITVNIIPHRSPSSPSFTIDKVVHQNPHQLTSSPSECPVNTLNFLCNITKQYRSHNLKIYRPNPTQSHITLPDLHHPIHWPTANKQGHNPPIPQVLSPSPQVLLAYTTTSCQSAYTSVFISTDE